MGNLRAYTASLETAILVSDVVKEVALKLSVFR